MPRRTDHLKPHQFKPGQSGNPGGRVKGKTLTSVLREILAEVDPDTKRTRLEDLARALIEKATKEIDIAAAHLVAERTEGKVKDVLEVHDKSRLPDLSDEELAKKLKNKGSQRE